MHNPLYANVEINEQWLLDAENDDQDLYSGLINNTDSESPTIIDNTEVVMNVKGALSHFRILLSILLIS